MDNFRLKEFENLVVDVLPFFEQRVITLTIILGLMLVFVGSMLFIFFFFRKRLKAKDSSDFNKKQKSLLFFKKYAPLIAITIVVIPAIFICWEIAVLTFDTKPHIVSSTPAVNSTMTSAIPNYSLEFDLPVDLEEIEFNISPEVEGEWDFETIWGSESLARKASFKPKSSTPPGQPVVIYVTGIRLWNDEGKLHEQAIEFMSPDVPGIKSISPENGTTDVVPTTDIIVQFDSPLGDFVTIDYFVNPTVEFSVEDISPDAQRISMKEELEQDKEYEVTLLRKLRTFNIETGESIKTSETEEISKIKFTTVSTPLLNSYSPKGTAANPAEPIKAEFDQKMNREDVEASFSITPDVAGVISWEGEKTFVYTPDTPLAFDTKYDVMFTKGIKSEVYGETEEDITFSFETAGPVEVVSFTPVNGSTGQQTSLTVSVVFDQEVDHASAQSKFTITPSASGSFTWEGNTMKYSMSNLAFYTNYTIAIAPGVKATYGAPSTKTFSSVFGTKSNITSISFPWYGQQEGFTCNCAATRMALAYYGVNLTEAQVKSGIGTSDNPNVGWVLGYGVHAGPVANFISKYRTAEVKTGWNIQGIAAEIQAGHPVILWWYNRYSTPAGAFTLPSGATGYTGMHSEVVYAFRGEVDNPTAFLVRDPWRGHLEYNSAFFYQNWAYLNYTAVVVK